MKKFFRVTALLLTVVMTLAIFAGCGTKTENPSSSNSSSAASSTSTGSNAPVDTIDWSHKGQTPEQIMAGPLVRPIASIKWPLSEKQITVKILKPLVVGHIDYKDMAILKEYEQRTNIHIEWNTPPAANFNDQAKLILNAGTDLPDAIIGYSLEAEISRLGTQGIFADIKSLVDKNMPNLKAAFEKYPVAKKNVTTDDGKMFSMPFIYQFTAGNNVLMGRQDWLDTLKMNPPETTDDWYKMLTAFKNDISKATGKTIYPFSGYGANGTGMNALRSLVSAWGVFDGFYVADKLAPKDGKVHYGPIETRYKEAVEWLRKLYSEGLVDPEILTNDAKAFQAKVLNGTVGAWRGYTSGDMNTLNESFVKANDTKSMIREFPIMKGPNGDQFHLYPDVPVLSGGMIITSVSKYQNELAKWADYWYSDVGQTYMMGIENVTYTKNEKGEPKYTDIIKKNPQGKNLNEARGMYSFGSSTWPSVFVPWSVTADLFAAYLEEGRLKYRKQELQVRPMPIGLAFTLEENTKNAKVMTDVDLTVAESITNFIIGKTPLNDTTWNEYVAKVKKIGIDDVIKNQQAAVDRYNKR